MQCIRPIRAYQGENGIVFKENEAIKGLLRLEFECRKCLPCRLNQAREKAIRCFHEAKMHEDNIFLTLTYSEEHLKSPKLIYRDFQLFMKKLRKEIEYSSLDKEKSRILYMVTGEYGDKNKRPHWHAIIFNYSPPDKLYKYTSDLGDKVWTSELLTNLWGKGNIEFGDVTMDSASYVARYGAKKLVHGKDQEHDFHPIHRTSNRRGIGTTWLEKNYKHTFEKGFVVLPNGETSKIPRYYVDWLKKNHPELYAQYITTVREEIIEYAEKKNRKEEIEYFTQVFNRAPTAPLMPTRNQVKSRILEKKFKRLQETLKL